MGKIIFIYSSLFPLELSCCEHLTYACKGGIVQAITIKVTPALHSPSPFLAIVSDVLFRYPLCHIIYVCKKRIDAEKRSKHLQALNITLIRMPVCSLDTDLSRFEINVKMLRKCQHFLSCYISFLVKTMSLTGEFVWNICLQTFTAFISTYDKIKGWTRNIEFT